MGDSVIRISSSAHLPSLLFFYFLTWLPLVQQLHSPVSQKCWLHPHPLTNPSPPTASQKDPLSAGGQVSMLKSPLLSSPLFASLHLFSPQCQRLLPPPPASSSSLLLSPPLSKGDEVMERRGNEAVLRCVPQPLSAKFQPRMPPTSMVFQLVSSPAVFLC